MYYYCVIFHCDRNVLVIRHIEINNKKILYHIIKHFKYLLILVTMDIRIIFYKIYKTSQYFLTALTPSMCDVIINQ